ncbi:unnamed protein product [marine sediment metagenome]|uniref:Uncharacterized protein n=1 Tax=marine sediment metagenome TaxID=412755 RepID=X1JUZ6_9ZZZZ
MLPKAKVDIKCGMCGLQVHPLVARYLWLGLGWRGRPSRKPHTTSEVTLCGPCADAFLVREAPYIYPKLVQQGGGR